MRRATSHTTTHPKNKNQNKSASADLLSCSNAPHIIATGLIAVVLAATVEADDPRIAAIASIGSRRPIIVRRSIYKYRVDGWGCVPIFT